MFPSSKFCVWIRQRFCLGTIRGFPSEVGWRSESTVLDLEFRIEETLFQRDLSLRKSVTLIMSILLSNPKLGSLVFRPENVTIISLVAICTGPPLSPESNGISGDTRGTTSNATVRSRGVTRVSNAHGKWGGKLDWRRARHKNDSFEQMNQTRGYAKRGHLIFCRRLGKKHRRTKFFVGCWTRNTG